MNAPTYVWHRARCWLDTGMRDYRGFALLWSLKPGSNDGVTVDPATTHQVTEAEERILIDWHWKRAANNWQRKAVQP